MTRYNWELTAEHGQVQFNTAEDSCGRVMIVAMSRPVTTDELRHICNAIDSPNDHNVTCIGRPLVPVVDTV